MSHAHRLSLPAITAAFAAILATGPGTVEAAKSTECTKGGICYCVNDELKATIASKVERFRQILAEQRKAGEAVSCLSVPLTSAGGGNFNINKEVAASAKAAIEKRFGVDYIYVLNPGTLDADLPKGGGADYMLMWTALLEGPDGLGDFDFVYFAGPQDFARYFGFDGDADMAKLEQFFDQRVKSDPRVREGGAERPHQAGVSPLLRVAGVGFREPRRARRMEHLPDDQRAPPRRREDRNDGPDSGALRRARGQPHGRRGGSLGRLRREMRAVNRRTPMIQPLLRRMARAVTLVPLLLALALGGALPARAADTVNAYSIWPENWARPMFQEFETATGIKVNFVRFSSGEALARVIAEKNNPRVDVLFGGPVETFAAGIKEGVFEPYKPPASAVLPPRFRQADGQWTAIADDPLVFMTNEKFLKENGLKAPASWDDLLNPPYKNMLQMADARTSGTAVTRIFSVLEVNGRDENKAFDYMKKLRPNVQLYTKSGGGGTLPVGLGQGRRRHLLHRRRARHQGQGLRRSNQLPARKASAPRPRRIALIKGAKNPDAGKKLIDWATSRRHAGPVRQVQDQFRAGPSGRRAGAEPGRGAQGREDLPDRRRLCGRQPQARRRPLDRGSAEPVESPSVASVAGGSLAAGPASGPRIPSSTRPCSRCGCCWRSSSSIRWQCCSPGC